MSEATDEIRDRIQEHREAVRRLTNALRNVQKEECEIKQGWVYQTAPGEVIWSTKEYSGPVRVQFIYFREDDSPHYEVRILNKDGKTFGQRLYRYYGKLVQV